MPSRRRIRTRPTAVSPRALRGLEEALLAVSAALTPPPAPALRAMTVRELGLRELGCYVYVPAAEYAPGTRGASEPTVEARAGRLVGLREGVFPTEGDPTPLRSLVLQQGGQTSAISVRVDAVVGIRYER